MEITLSDRCEAMIKPKDEGRWEIKMKMTAWQKKVTQDARRHNKRSVFPVPVQNQNKKQKKVLTKKWTVNFSMYKRSGLLLRR